MVKLYVLMDDGTLASESLKREVLEICNADEVRPLADLVLVEDSEIVPYDIQFTYYIPQQSIKSGAEISAAVQAAVEKYVAWQYGKLRWDINPSKLYSLLGISWPVKAPLAERIATLTPLSFTGQRELV